MDTYRLATRLTNSCLLAVVGTVAASAVFDFSGHGIQVVGPAAGRAPHLSVPPLNWRLVHELLPVAGFCFVIIVGECGERVETNSIKHLVSASDRCAN